MDRLAEHLKNVADEKETIAENERKAREEMARTEAFIKLERVERLLADDGVKWWLSELSSIVKHEHDQALNVKLKGKERTHHAHRHDIGREFLDDLANRKAALLMEVKQDAPSV